MSPATAEQRPGTLVDFARAQLPGMRLDDGIFCHELGAPGERASGGRLGRGRRTVDGSAALVRGRSLRYSWIVLVGVLRDGDGGAVPPGELKRALVAELDSPDLTAGDYGLALWADARSGGELFARTLGLLEQVLGLTRMEPLENLEIGWVAIGAAEAAAAGAGPEAERVLARARERLLARSRTPSGLFLHHDAGGRARFPHFATQIYGVLALTRLARLRDDPNALRAARRVADRLCELQLPDGAWPWIYDVRRGVVVEPYRLYSVHQDAMAPMALLELSEVTGEARYRDAALRGLGWLWGGNELGVQMLDARAGMLYRSINRRGFRDRVCLWLNSAAAQAGRTVAEWPGAAEVERTDRPYHLGWVLEAWTARAAVSDA